MVRAKFKLTSITAHDGNGDARSFTFYPVQDDGIPENQSFNKWTPSGELKIYVTNPQVIQEWKLGDSYYLDFTPAPKKV